MPNYISLGGGDWFALLDSEVTTLSQTFQYGIAVSVPTATAIATIKAQTQTDGRKRKRD